MNMKVVMECMYQSMQWRWLRLAPQCFAFTSLLYITGIYCNLHCIYIYLSYVLGHGANLYRVQNGQDGRPLRSHCVRLKYSPRIASKGKEIVRNETDTPTTPSGKDTGIGRRNHVNYSSYTLENFTGP